MRFRALMIVAVLAGAGRSAAADCELYNDTPIFLQVEGSSGVLRPFFTETYDSGVTLSASTSFDQPVKPPPLKVKCSKGAAVKLSLDGGQLVATQLPRSIRITPDWKSGKAEVRGPAGLTLRIAGRDVPVTKGKATFTPELRALVLEAELVGPEQLVYGYTPVWVEAAAGKTRLSVAFAANAIQELSRIEDEAFEVERAPLGWGAALNGGAPHPGLYITQHGLGASKKLLAVNGLKRLADAQIVAVGKLQPHTVETCRYTSSQGTTSLERDRIDLEVTVYEATTGKKLDQKQFSGGEPKACPDRTATPYTIEGPHPDDSAIAWLAGL
jgi:hypothetical protein